RFYIVGRGKNKDQKRILKIDRSEPSELVLVEDPTVYTARQCSALLQQLAEGNRSSGGLRLVTKAYGIVGCVRFLEPWYLILVRRRRQVGCMRGHAVFRIEESLVLTVPHASVHTSVASSTMEQRYKRLLSGVDLTKDFFYSHSYPVMRSLQDNVCRTVTGCTECGSSSVGLGPCTGMAHMAHEHMGNVPRMGHMAHMAHEHMFVWNSFLTRSIRHALGTNRWTLALSHGFFHQERMSIFGRVISLVLIARRSRHFAGTRYLKRGVNDRGRVANEVEVEQLLLDHSHEPILPPPTALHREPMPSFAPGPVPTTHRLQHQSIYHHRQQQQQQQHATSPPPSPASSSSFLLVQPFPSLPSSTTHPPPISPRENIFQITPVPGDSPAGSAAASAAEAAVAAAAAVAVAAVGAASAAALPAMASVVQVRGSIPLFWSQQASRLSPKPDIVLHRYDPMYTAARLHFENLMERYGRPIIILNLIKTVEKHPREMILRREFAMAVAYLNRVLPPPSALTYIHWDFSRYAKSSANAATTPAGVTSAAASALSTLTTTPNAPTIPNTPTTLHTLTTHPSPFSSFPSSSLISPSSSLISPSSPSASSFSLSPPSLSPRATNTSATNAQASSGSGSRGSGSNSGSGSGTSSSTGGSGGNGSGSEKSKGSVAEGVLGALAAIARECLAKTGFFYSGQLASLGEGVLGALAAIARECLAKTGFVYPGQLARFHKACFVSHLLALCFLPCFPISSAPPPLFHPNACNLARAATKACFSSCPAAPRSAPLPSPCLTAPPSSPPPLPLLPCLPNACNLARAATKTFFSSRATAPPSAATTTAAAPSTTGPEEGVRSKGGSKGAAAAAAAAVAAAAAEEEEETGRWVRPPQLQHGIVRTNCLDCLDRTNVAQFVIGREALAHQLHSLGITDSPHLDSKSDVGKRLQGMYIAMGDALALQYGGSAAHNLVIAERPGTWRSTLQSQEVLKSLHRYYSNAITDADKQDAINL
ncbi:unnamed protein product, partial [Closterium sp. Naga37s-1]